MKLVTYRKKGSTRIGISFGDYLYDLQSTLDAGRPGRQPIPQRMNEFLDTCFSDFEEIEAGVSAILRSSEQAVRCIVGDYELSAPVPFPGKIICAGLNYHDHCTEQNIPVPDRLITFAKYPSAVIGPEAAISWTPGTTDKVDYEAELAFVIGRTARNVSENEAFQYVAGYTVTNDVSARDVQFAEKQWVRAKSFDTFCPMGPYLVTTNEVPDPHNLSISCRVNGEERQRSNTRELIFKIPYIVSFLSQACTLYPGDVVLTGTPGGVGIFRNPPVFLKPGDRVEVEIENVGRLINFVR